MDRRFVVISFLAAVACSKSEAPSTQGAATTTRDSASGSVTSVTAAASAPASPASRSSGAAPGGGAQPANPQGRIPVLEYHVIGSATNSLYSRTADAYRNDLETAYRLGYRPITIAQMLDKDFRDVPAGMSPVVFVYDDASDSQFRYIEKDGKLEIDPTSGLGIWLDFAKTHPGWNNRGTYCMLNGAAAGHNFFGDNPKYNGQKKEWRFQKVKWLADNGFELCDHTVWHMKLNQYPDAQVQQQIAANALAIDSAVPGYRIRTIALPYGLWPKNRQLAWQGTWTDPKTGQAHPYKFDAVLEVAGGPTRSPYDPQFNPHSINRVEAIGDDIPKTLQKLKDTKTAFVK
jgi:hypothetical protein